MDQKLIEFYWREVKKIQNKSSRGIRNTVYNKQEREIGYTKINSIASANLTRKCECLTIHCRFQGKAQGP